MSLKTRSVFYYGLEITSDNLYLDFKEGAGSELSAELEVGSYTHSEIAAVIKTALEDAGALTYTVTLNRTTRIITIAASGAFTILGATGTHTGSSCLSLLGYAASDTSSAVSHVASSACGTAYTPQFILQDHVATDHSQRLAYANVNKSASGRVQVQRFGTEQFLQCSIKFITDIPQTSAGPITSNPTGVADAQAFMEWCIAKQPLEYMANSSAPDTYERVLLESTPQDQSGTAFELREAYDRGLPGYFETGVLRFRKLED
jgi:hypothetical protein